MIGSFLTRGLVMVFGYAYPAYECYKTVEMNKPDIEQLRFWCQYWILVAMLSVCERIGDTFVSWVPMYSETKLAFFIYLWYPKTKGTTYVYDSFFRPYISKHEPEIDRNLLEMRSRAGDIVVLYWQKTANYVQTRGLEILQYIASQSTLRPRAADTKQGAKVRQTTISPNKKPVDTQPKSAEPPSSGQDQDVSGGMKPSQSTSTAPSASFLDAQKTQSTQSVGETHASLDSTEAKVVEIESSSTLANENDKPPQDAMIEEAIRVTRGRLRRNRGASNH